MELRIGVILSVSCILAATSAASAKLDTPFRPTSFVRTKSGLNVTVFEKTVSNVTYFFSPSAILKLASMKHAFNSGTSRHEVRFDVELWSDDYCEEVSSLTSTSLDALSVYPFDSVRLVASELDPKKYTLPRNQVFMGSNPRVLHFAIPGIDEEDCEDLCDQVKGSLDEKAGVTFELEFRNDTAAETVDMDVLVGKHVLPTEMFKKVKEKGGDEALLTEKALKEFAEQVAGRFVAAGGENGTRGSIEFKSPDDATKIIRKGLFQKRISASPETDWANVVKATNDDDSTAASGRPLYSQHLEKLRKKMNKIFEALSKHVNKTKGPTTNLPSTAKAPVGPNLYIVNMTDLSNREKIATVKVTSYPPEARIRFPVTVVDNEGYHYDKPTIVALSVLQFSWVLIPMLFVACFAHAIRQHRKRMSKYKRLHP